MSNISINKNPLIDLSNINPNKILEISFNYELLKYILTALINNQQNMNEEITKLKTKFLHQQKHSAELESDIIDLKIQRVNSPEELDKLYIQKNELNSRNKQLNTELESLIEQKKELTPQKMIQIYNMEKQKYENIKDISQEESNLDNSNKVNENESEKEKKVDINKKEKKDKKENEVTIENVIIQNNNDINQKFELLMSDIASLKSSIQTLQQDLSSLRTKSNEQFK